MKTLKEKKKLVGKICVHPNHSNHCPCFEDLLNRFYYLADMIHTDKDTHPNPEKSFSECLYWCCVSNRRVIKKIEGL